MGASVVSGVDASPVLEATKHDFDLVTLSVERGVVRDGDLRLRFEGMQIAVPLAASACRNQSAL